MDLITQPNMAIPGSRTTFWAISTILPLGGSTYLTGGPHNPTGGPYTQNCCPYNPKLKSYTIFWLLTLTLQCNGLKLKTNSWNLPNSNEYNCGFFYVCSLIVWLCHLDIQKLESKLQTIVSPLLYYVSMLQHQKKDNCVIFQ